MGGAEAGPLRLARPTFEGDEPERESGGVCTDIMAEWDHAAVNEMRGEETQHQKSRHTRRVVCNALPSDPQRNWPGLLSPLNCNEILQNIINANEAPLQNQNILMKGPW